MRQWQRDHVSACGRRRHVQPSHHVGGRQRRRHACPRHERCRLIEDFYERAARFLIGMRDHEFERLYEEHAQPLFRFLVYRTGDRALSEDLLADAFERALRARTRFDPRSATVYDERMAGASRWPGVIRCRARSRDSSRQTAMPRTLLPCASSGGE